MAELDKVIQYYLSKNENNSDENANIVLSHRVISFMQAISGGGNKKLLKAKEMALKGEIEQQDAQYIKIMVLMYKSCCVDKEYEKRYKPALKRNKHNETNFI